MKKRINQDDLLKYLYNEVNDQQKKEVENALAQNPELEEQFFDFLDMKKQLDDVSKQNSPSQKSINNILKFSKSFGKDKLKK
ncbi:hypothetical protein [Chondrinema litorale]|uniref:hypothetical protein n=1 Tax=Chondrinema litorale TaxID=2994555 RepID=UPI0025433651|nr:hypothetical protein [Chondrinema litorale]UZR94015.1 hypothetical protein OQ292_19420 [Chondrinema litorale]